MSKFKVGDRVRYIGDTEQLMGYTYTVTCTGSGEYCDVRTDSGRRFSIPNEQLFRVPESQINAEISLESMQARIAELEDRIEDLTELSDNQTKLKVRFMKLHSQVGEERDALIAERAQKAEKQCEELAADLIDNRRQFNQVADERDALQAKLDALKPKPVIEVRYARATTDSIWLSAAAGVMDLKLTFTDGVLTHAEVLTK